MKRLIVLLSVLSLVAMLLPSRTPAQDDWDIEFRAKRRAAPAPVAIRTYAEPPPVILPMYAGTGCRGAATYAGGGCISRSAAPTAYQLVPVTGGCYGRAAGYGASLGNGQFATPSGRPAPPGVFPINGPIIGSWRAAAGYDRHYRP